MNAVYGQGLRALALAGRAGREAVARWATRTADEVTEALVDRAWDEEPSPISSGPTSGARPWTIHGLMPLILPDLPWKTVERLASHLE